MDHFSLLERSCAVFEFFLDIWLQEKSNDLKKYCVPPIIFLIFPYFRSSLGGVRTQIPQFYFMPMTQNIVQTLWVVKPNKNISYF